LPSNMGPASPRRTRALVKRRCISGAPFLLSVQRWRLSALLHVCVCVCVCARAPPRACVRACVFVCCWAQSLHGQRLVLAVL